MRSAGPVRQPGGADQDSPEAVRRTVAPGGIVESVRYASSRSVRTWSRRSWSWSLCVPLLLAPAAAETGGSCQTVSGTASARLVKAELAVGVGGLQSERVPICRGMSLPCFQGSNLASSVDRLKKVMRLLDNEVER
jgi:hypothetical protein